MSLLEDLFLQDEANEAQELERIIEGDEYDDRPRSAASNSDENSAKEDEAEEDKRRVDPANEKTRRVIKNPRFVLNPARLTGPRGIEIIPDHFKDFKFKGKGHEKEDLDLVLKKLEHWAYRLYPKFAFEDCLKKIEILGKKRPVMVHLQKIRSDQLLSVETIVQKDSSDDEEKAPPEEDEFDKLLQQQIDLARATPAPESARKPPPSTPRHVTSPFTMPKATSSPSISDEQKERMQRNRKLAEERRLARLKQNSSNENPKVEFLKLNTVHEGISNENEHSNSSDEEYNLNVPMTVQINDDKATANCLGDEDEIIYDSEVNKLDNSENKTNTKKAQSDNISAQQTENSLEYENETADDHNVKELQKDVNELDNENNIMKTNEDTNIVNNPKYEESLEVLNNDVITITKEKHNDGMVYECTSSSLITEENPGEPQIEKDVTTVVKGAEKAGYDNEFKIVNCDKKTTEIETEKVNDLPHGISSEKAESGGNGTVKTAEAVQDPDIDKLVENELMDIDFDDEF